MNKSILLFIALIGIVVVVAMNMAGKKDDTASTNAPQQTGMEAPATGSAPAATEAPAAAPDASAPAAATPAAPEAATPATAAPAPAAGN